MFQVVNIPAHICLSFKQTGKSLHGEQ